MNLKPFTVGTTNIFPIVNSKAGGQLCTEFNLRSRETVYSDSSIEYPSGPSFTHSLKDFKVTTLLGSSSTLSISRGRALINGHYVESLVDFEIDLQAANLVADPADKLPDGRLAIGLLAVYSTAPTIAGAMKAENATGVYEGIHLVILPTTAFKTPLDEPANEMNVTAHIKLAEFTYADGVISNLIDNETRVQAFSADRIGSIDALLSDEYIKRINLDPKQLYVLSGKGDSSSTEMNWCTATGSLMVWDSSSQLVLQPTDPTQILQEATFAYNGVSDTTTFSVPHKQPDKALVDAGGYPLYYAPKTFILPNASITGNKGGVVTKAYNNYITQLRDQYDMLKVLPNGKMLRYIPLLESRSDLPVLGVDILNYTVGDYILVREDQTTGATAGNYPVTMYVVIPVEQSGIDRTYTFTQTTPSGIRFGEPIAATSIAEYDVDDPGSAASIKAVKDYCVDASVPGIAGNNYVEVVIGSGSTSSAAYYVIDPVAEKTYSDPLIISAEVAPATTTTIGGFLNIDQDQTGYGYVYMDEDNHLRMADFDLLVSGVLAYQLGEDVKTGVGADIATINEQLTQYVNERVAFPTPQHSATSNTPSVITVTITLPEDVGDTHDLYIFGIDSRFTTSVTLAFVGTSSADLNIHIADCERIKIEIPVGFLPKINLYRCNLYYDADVLNSINSIESLQLWYERRSLSDPEIAVEGMRVSRLTPPTVVQNETYWSGTQTGDSHYKYALQSITFSPTGVITECELLVTDNITSAPNVSAISPAVNVGAYQFTLPIDGNFTYPVNRLSKQLKVGGQFITAFAASGSQSAYILKNTSFTAVSQYYEVVDGSKVLHPGMISFYTVISMVESITGAPASHEDLESWRTNKFYRFGGGAIE